MIVRSLTVRSLTTYTDLSLDLSGIADRSLVAVVGPNGAGKTTLLECLCGAYLYQSMRGGSLSRWATSRNALIEAAVEYGGSSYRHKLLIDSQGTGEAYLYRDGVPVDGANGKVSAYAKQIEAKKAAGYYAPDRASDTDLRAVIGRKLDES